MKFKRIEVNDLYDIPDDLWCEVPVTYYWRKGVKDAYHYKAYSYVEDNGSIEWASEVGETVEDACHYAEYFVMCMLDEDYG